MSLNLTALLLLQGVIPGLMHDRVATRMHDFDRFVAHVVHRWYRVSSQDDPFDPSRWRQITELNEFEHRVTVVRPNLLDEWLTNNPAAGYEPVNASVFQGTYVSQQTAHDGTPLYCLYGDGVQAGVFKWVPLLQAFDIHIQDSTIPQLNVLSIFDRTVVQLVSANEDFSRYSASITGNALNQEYEFDLAPDGKLLHLRTTVRSTDAAFQPGTWEQRVLQFTRVNEVDFPTRTAIVVYNPNVTDERAVHEFVVDSFQLFPALPASAVQIMPILQNAIVNTYFADGSNTRQRYDGNGNIVERTTLLWGPEPQNPPGHGSARRSVDWLKYAAPATVVGVGILGLSVALFIRRSAKP